MEMAYERNSFGVYYIIEQIFKLLNLLNKVLLIINWIQEYRGEKVFIILRFLQKPNNI